MTESLPAAGSVNNTAPPGPLKEFWQYFCENRGALAGLIVFIAICLMAIFADWIAPHSPSEQYRDSFLVPPFWSEEGSTRFILGTDAVGRDIFFKTGLWFAVFSDHRRHCRLDIFNVRHRPRFDRGFREGRC